MDEEKENRKRSTNGNTRKRYEREERSKSTILEVIGTK
jgi:hypothetical protein